MAAISSEALVAFTSTSVYLAMALHEAVHVTSAFPAPDGVAVIAHPVLGAEAGSLLTTPTIITMYILTA